MMGPAIKLDVEMRDVGKRATHLLRKAKKIPAIVYGAIPNHSIAVTEKALLKYSSKRFENTIFHLQCEANSQVHNTPVLIKSIDRDPVTQMPLHLDFYAPDMTKEVRITVELKFTGKAIGEAEGGVLEIMQHDLELFCLPGHIPNHIQVDVSSLKMGDIYHISHLKLPKGIKSAVSADLPLCAVKEPRKVVVETPTDESKKEVAASTPPDKEAQKSKETSSAPSQKDKKTNPKK